MQYASINERKIKARTKSDQRRSVNVLSNASVRCRNRQFNKRSNSIIKVHVPFYIIIGQALVGNFVHESFYCLQGKRLTYYIGTTQ